MLFLVFLTAVGFSSACIPMHTDDFETTTPAITTSAAPTTTPKDPCAGCVVPPIKSSGYPAACNPDVAGTVTLSMKAEGDKCLLIPSGCPIGFLYSVGGSCQFTTTPTPPPNVECVDGQFKNTIQNALVDFYVGGCSEFTWD